MSATNLLSHFLITKDLFPKHRLVSQLRGGAQAVTMSRRSNYDGPLFDPIFFKRQRGALEGNTTRYYKHYHQSKLANLAFTATLDHRL